MERPDVRLWERSAMSEKSRLANVPGGCCTAPRMQHNPRLPDETHQGNHSVGHHLHKPTRLISTAANILSCQLVTIVAEPGDLGLSNGGIVWGNGPVA